MKGKRYTTEEKIRVLREADKGVAITEVCKCSQNLIPPPVVLVSGLER